MGDRYKLYPPLFDEKHEPSDSTPSVISNRSFDQVQINRDYSEVRDTRQCLGFSSFEADKGHVLEGAFVSAITYEPDTAKPVASSGNGELNLSSHPKNMVQHTSLFPAVTIMKMETATKKRKLDPTKPSNADLASYESSRLATYTRWLEDQNILGYARDVGKKVYTKKYYEIDPAVLRATMAGTFKRALLTRCLANPTMSNTSISTYIEQITPCVVDMCMSALYAKLRSIHKLYGQHGTRYTTSSAYDRDFELPLPFAMAIQELGVFQTHSLETNHFCIPTFPEGTTDEGRSSPAFPGTEYMSCLPFLKGNGIPCKSVDTHLNRGTAWWTYKAEKVCGTFDLVCTLPASHYDDCSAVLRSVFLTSGTNEECLNFVAFEDGIANYGTRLREFQPGRNVCSFLALCHAPSEEWSVGRS